MKMMIRQLILGCALSGAVVVMRNAHAASDPAGATNPQPVHIILWFDAEDYLLPADDDATKRLCKMLTARGIRATFKIVGEKARVLERRGRNDVIAALKKHDLGYHTDLHSVHPTPSEYLAECGWLDGIAEFARREGAGAADVRRIFGLPILACYGQPGSSWAPQAIAALPQIGIAPCCVDEGPHVGLNQQPFWYAGALNVYDMGPNHTRMGLFDPQEVEPTKQKFAEIAGRLRRAGGGLISIHYHPCEWVQQEFWDAVNFKRGANPPREQWRAPLQRSAVETDAAFRRFAEYIDYIRTVPGVDWVTASDLPGLYPDLVRLEGAAAGDLTELARRITQAGVDFQRIGEHVYSVADQFELFVLALHDQPAQVAIKTTGLLGPDAPPPGTTLTNLNGFALRDALRDVYKFIRIEHRVPARVFIGAAPVAPADFLLALAAAWMARPSADGILPLGHHVPVLPERHIAPDTPDLFGGWVIHRENFRAPQIVEQARLQAWTLKPAILKERR